jgi:hypothetical protein
MEKKTDDMTGTERGKGLDGALPHRGRRLIGQPRQRNAEVLVGVSRDGARVGGDRALCTYRRLNKKRKKKKHETK